MRVRRKNPLPDWKKGLLVGIFGLSAVLLAANLREKGELSWEAASGEAVSKEAVSKEALSCESRAEAGQKETEKDEQTKEASLPDETLRLKKAEGENMRIALTFDDGPHPYYTDELLDGLKERGVKATFFLLGCNIEGNEEVIRRMAEEGHLIGNHTYYHVDITSLPEDEACAEIQDTSQKITDITGQPVEYVRPPFGNWDKELERKVMMIPIFWSVDTLDWQTKNEERIVQEVISEAEENDIILMHDSYKSTVKAALRIVDLLQAQGYEFVTADELVLE